MQTVRKIGDVTRDLRVALKLTQQGLAVAMGSAVSTIVRYESGGSPPNLQALAKMVELARERGLDDLAAELQVHLNVKLGPDFVPVTLNEVEKYLALIARRIIQNPKRHAAFLRFAKPEIEILKTENKLRKQHADELVAGIDAFGERLKAKERKS